MSTEVATQNQPRLTENARGTGRRGGNRGGNRGRGGSVRTNRGGSRPVRSNVKEPQAKSEAIEKEVTVEKPLESAAAAEDADEDTEAVCWICAEPVKYYAVAECNHRTCHVCALRLRALYKKNDCTFCKDPQPSMIFTVSPDAPFSSYAPEAIAYKDAKLSIYFETQEMMEETLILLRFNCPDPDCDYIGNGWADLKLHARATHGKLMCDLCIRFKKVFSHEHALYPPNLLPVHLPSMYSHQRKAPPKEQPEGGIHPLCEFCRECFFSGDELYAHMRERHEECFICKRNDVRDQYFQNYESLERHFNTVHHPCHQAVCQARKFVVFNTTLDLQAHMVEEHGADMTSRDKKDARRIQAEFAFEEVGHGGRHGRRGDREREREPPPHRQAPPQQQQQLPPEAAPSGPSRPAGIGARRREAFGGSLTVEGNQNTSSNNATPVQSRPPSPPREDVDPATAERHAAFLTRLQSLAANTTTAVPAVKAAIRSYRTSESSARDLISTIWNVLDRNLEGAASIVNAFVDLLDEEEKKQDLLSSWKGFAIEQRRQFPDLVPSAVGGGYASITSGRVLNAKHSTNARSSRQSTRQVWDRVAQAASSSSSSSHTPAAARPPDRFPALSSTASPAPALVPSFRQGQRNTPWSQSSASGFRAPSALPGPSPATVPEPKIQVVPAPASRSGSGSNTPRQAPPKLSNALFPELPSTTNARQKPQVSGNVSLRNILGNNIAPAVPAWQSSGGGSNGNATSGQAAEDGDAGAATAGKGKKSKGKQKQTLFTLGSFPT
ncbi:hypothetical protein BDQ12DRAFT_249403 [Crucibulum laeve]|uniref:RING-type E3 ubiquitin transferase n=1 Tax=Crucibulum laeve TaxID=68775 RepID=A0A5C3LTC1_9AGAR|nr:hypothetical protein BDQ12DRAFT_249403 [Crucibulum laeve]